MYSATDNQPRSGGSGQAVASPRAAKEERPERVTRAERAERAGKTQPQAAPVAPISPTELVNKIQSQSFEDKEYAAKRIVREGITDAAVLDTLEKELLTVYNLAPRDRNRCDSVAWMVKALGAAKLPKYKGTISEIAQKARNGAIKKYAKQTLSAY